MLIFNAIKVTNMFGPVYNEGQGFFSQSKSNFPNISNL